MRITLVKLLLAPVRNYGIEKFVLDWVYEGCLGRVKVIPRVANEDRHHTVVA